LNRSRIVWVLGIAIAVWAIALLRPAPPPPRVTPTHTRQEDVPTTPVAAPVPPQPRVLTATQPHKEPTPVTQRANAGTITRDDHYREKLAGVIAEQRKVNEERYARAIARWPQEQRQEPWAAEREQRLRLAMEQDEVDALLGSLECRATLCRLEISAQDSNAALALSNAHELTREAGSQIASGMSGGGLDRHMILFVAREGQSLDR
jgi:hypothetical protein